jgi:hypothetical protein
MGEAMLEGQLGDARGSQEEAVVGVPDSGLEGRVGFEPMTPGLKGAQVRKRPF